MKPVIGITCGIELVVRSSFREVLLDAYSEGIERAGGVPVILPNTEDPSLAGDMAARLDGVMITGGPDMDPRLFGGRADKTVSRKGTDHIVVHFFSPLLPEASPPAVFLFLPA